MSYRPPSDRFDLEEVSPQIRARFSGHFENVLRSADVRRERLRARREFVQSDSRSRASAGDRVSDEEN
jgi:hypothetical protein